jgi:hypothetical protein
MSNGELKEKGLNAQNRLQRALMIIQPLSKAYHLKEELDMIWKQQNKQLADAALTEWIRKADAAENGAGTGAVKIIACIEYPVVIDKILTHLDKKAALAEPTTLPQTRAPPQACLFD